MLSPYARQECVTILAIGVLLALAAVMLGAWWLSIIILLVVVALLAFFRDPERRVPTQRGAVVAPADGRISSIHEVEHFEPFNDGATCIRIFLSVLDVHVNRSPCHGEIVSITHKPGEYLNALNPDSAERNESTLLVMVHPIRRHPIAAVRQVAGMLARTIVCGTAEGKVVQRGERIGIIKLGSTTEVYLPHQLSPQVSVEVGQKVKGGLTVVATLSSRDSAPAEPANEEPPTKEPPIDTPSEPMPESASTAEPEPDPEPESELNPESTKS